MYGNKKEQKILVVFHLDHSFLILILIELRESNAVIQIQILYDDDSTHIFEYQTTQ